MILFKRVGSAFKGIEGREWALLTLETLGVVAGIMIAFELNEWASRRNEAARHQMMMERLFEESEWDITILRPFRDGMREQVKDEEEFASQLSSGKCPPEDLWRAVGTVAMLPALDAPRSVYNELMGAGGLSSIDDESVRAQITNFNRSMAWGQKQIDYFRMVKRDPVPAEDARVRVAYDPKADEPQVETYDREALCSDQAFKNRMAQETRQHRVALSYHEGAYEDAIWMCAALGESLGRRCNPTVGGQLAPDDMKILNKAILKYREDHAKKSPPAPSK
ncbi:hypothetical protein [Sphingomonas alba]|uniref:Uncharacterized protein n=1 Tax=Sphingomonas alba TaxID=2908208 RepID=A0ABT0RN30_9SPHN|nr:hypothetical protein [Sphingomonas alba]MCL6684061.1 hypothetical protein [Sphingomonas alba]